MTTPRHTVLMPVARPKNIRILAGHMRGQGVEWRALVSQIDINNRPYGGADGYEIPAFPQEDWIKVHKFVLPTTSHVEMTTEVVPALSRSVKVYRPTVNPGNWLADRFLDAMVKSEPDFFSKDHYVSMMTDDTLWMTDHWRILQRHFERRPAMVSCAHKFGNSVTPAMPGNKERPVWENNSLLCFCTRSEATTVRADLLKDWRWGDLWCADGFLVERLREHPDGVVCANDTMIYWSALNPKDWGFAHHER